MNDFFRGRARRLLLLNAMACLSMTAAAQTNAPGPMPTGPWTLAAAVDYAVANNLNLRNTTLTSQLDVATLNQSRAGMLPTINAQGTQNYNFGTSIDPLTNQFTSTTIRSNNFSFGGSVPLYQGGALRNTVQRNKLTAQASAQDVEKARNDLRVNVASAYLQVLLNRETLRSTQLQRQTTVAQVERAEKQLKLGAIAESSVLDLRAQLATEDVNVVNAENNLLLNTLRLEQQLNVDPKVLPPAQFLIQEPVVADPPADQPLDLTSQQVYETASSALPDLKVADLRLAAARRGVDVARGNLLPRLSLNASLFSGFSSQRSSFLPNGDTLLRPVGFVINPVTGQPVLTAPVATFQPGGTFQPTDFASQVKDNYGKQVGLTLTIPIVNGLQSRTQLIRSRLQVQQAQLNADQARLTLRQTIEQATLDAESARRRYVAASAQVNALTLSLKNADIRLTNGLLNGTDYAQIKNNFARAQADQLQAKYEFLFRRKVLDVYMGRPLEL